MKLRTVLFLLSSLAILSLTTGGWIYYSSLKKSVWREAQTQSEYHSEKIRNFISNYLTNYQKAVKALSGITELQKALSNPDEAKNIIEASIILDHFADSFQVEVSYLMNQKGVTIASSNRNDKFSFVGHNYSFRPYFKEAILGNPSVYMATGVTSQKRGVYYSHPVYAAKGGKPVGVVVVKAGVETIEKEFINIRFSPGMITVLTGPHGVVFLSDHHDFLFHLLWRTTNEKVAEIVKSDQFGKGPWEWAGFEKKNKNQVVDQAGNEYLMFQKSIKSLPGWDIVHLNNIK
ncbi:MAG: transcriptional regulator, partial [Deltaproteobacteria bacterium]